MATVEYIILLVLSNFTVDSLRLRWVLGQFVEETDQHSRCWFAAGHKSEQTVPSKPGFVHWIFPDVLQEIVSE